MNAPPRDAAGAAAKQTPTAVPPLRCRPKTAALRPVH
jgi:hypothetical protein